MQFTILGGCCFANHLTKMAGNICQPSFIEKPLLQTRKRQRVGGCNRTFVCSRGKAAEPVYIGLLICSSVEAGLFIEEPLGCGLPCFSCTGRHVTQATHVIIHKLKSVHNKATFTFLAFGGGQHAHIEKLHEAPCPGE